ncbi:MAG TPA: hypothetical protein VGK19_14120 [Capsulimonadaceae bacterium]|jgi:hypothetical protein
MEKKTTYNTRDGRAYDVSINWNPDIKLSEHIFPIKFQFVDKVSGKALKLPREIETYAVGTPEDTLGQRVDMHYAGNKDSMFVDFLESAIRRVTDYVERGR